MRKTAFLTGWVLLCAAFLSPVPVTAADKTLSLPRNGRVCVGKKAPKIASWDLNDSVVTLSRILERPGTRAVLVSFYASWCNPCRKGLRMLENGRKRFRDKGVTVLLVNYGEDAETISEFHRKFKLSLPVVSDEFKEIGKEYCVTKLPRVFLVGKDGKVRAIYIYEGDDFIERVLRDAGID